MKIVHLTPSLSRKAGGPFVSVRRLAQCLYSLGQDVSVLGIDDEYTARDLPLWKPLVPLVSQRRTPRKLGYAPGLKDALEMVCADLVHTHGLWMYPSLAAFRWAQTSGKPHIVSPRGMLEPWAWRHNRWKKRPLWWAWEKRNVESAAVLHATASEEADNLRALGLKNPIAVIPNGVDIPEWYEESQRVGRRTALFISRIHPKKGLLNLVKAWAVLRPTGWRFIVVGPSQDGHEEEVKTTVREAGLEDQFEFPGPVYEDAKWNLYRQADLFVLPSFSENFGIVVAEALASGVPVITTKGTPWRELEERSCGWWVDIGVEPLVASLRAAIALSDAERRAMGVRGRHLVEEKYSWPKIAAQMIDVYRWVLDQGPKPDCVRID